MHPTETVIAVLDDDPQLLKAPVRLLKARGHGVEIFARCEELLTARTLRTRPG